MISVEHEPRTQNRVISVALPARQAMATVTHYIRDDDYTDNLQEQKTGQEPSGDAPEDPWQTESSSAGFNASRRLTANAQSSSLPFSHTTNGDTPQPLVAHALSLHSHRLTRHTVM